MTENYLEWDSIFFDLPVYKKKYNEEFDEITLSKGLTYLFSSIEIVDLISCLYDVKVTFQKKDIQENIKIDKHIVSYLSTCAVSEDLLNLSYQSGEYSRFRKDPKIPNNKFLELYKLWILNSVNRSFSDEVFTYKIYGVDVGMITLNKDKEICKIGLLAVNNKHRGNKIGQKLMIAAEKWALDNNCNQMLVETQENNTIAIEFYKKMNYNTVQKEYIYHLWK